MSTPAFLRPGGAERSDRFQPLQRSSLVRALERAGAQLDERDGWLVAVRVAGGEGRDPRVRDATHRYSVYEGEAPAPLEAGEGALALRLSSGRAFMARPRGAQGDVPAGMLELSAGYAALEIEGEGAATLVRRLTALDLDALPAVGALAHLRAWVFRPAPERFLVFFPQEYGDYLWEVAVDAAAPLGGGPAA